MTLGRLTIISALLILLAAGSATAQLSLGGTPVSFNKAVSSNIETVTMGEVDVEKMLAEDEIDQKNEMPYRFGYPFDVEYNLENSGTWEKLADGSRIWRLRIECPGAYSINFQYDDFWLPEGALYYIYNEDHSMVIGAFSSQNNKEHGKFATNLVKGDVSILEYYEPANVKDRGRISISRIVHAYRNMFSWEEAKGVVGNDPNAKGFGQSGSCNNNVNCPEGADWQDQKRSVAMVLLGSGAELCSGTMINNVRQDLTPYFLTANHCLGGESTWIIMFNYESPNCNNIDGPRWMTVSGTTLRASASYSDFGLVELSAQPPDSYNVYYAGWNAVDTAADSVVAIHHPAGDIKKISFDYDRITATSYLGTSVPGDNSHWRIGQWEDGTTEGGSSGSPIFDREKHIKGQLHGGYASCTSITSDYYGKFSQSWDNGSSASTRLRDWLDPDNTGTLVLDGRDAAGIKITHTPLSDVTDTLNSYEVLATITSNVALKPDSLLLYYQISSVWYEDTLTATGNQDEYAGYIPAQSPGTVISYYLMAVDIEGKADTTNIYVFKVIDYAVSMDPASATDNGAVDDTVWYTLTVTNAGVYPDDYSLNVASTSWSSSLWDITGTTPVTSTGTLPGSGTFDFKVRVIVPTSFYGETDTATVTATSTGDPTKTATSMLYTVSDGQPLTIPFTDDFPGTTFDIGKWVVTSTAEINDVGINEPSSPYSVDLNGNPNGGDTLITQAIDLTGQSNVIVRYWYERTGGGNSTESGDDLFIEYLDSTNIWQVIQQHLGSDTDMTDYEEVVYSLPGNAFHSGFRLRVRNIGTAGNFDDWFVDDIFIGQPSAYEVEMTPPFASQYGPSDDTVSYLMTIINKGASADEYQLSDSNGTWSVSFFDVTGMTPISTTGPVSPADSVQITAKVAIPSGAAMNDVDSVNIYAVSINDPNAFDMSQLTTISAGAPGGFPWYEPFPYDTLFSPRWLTNTGAVVNTSALNPPSSPYTFNFDGGDTAVTQLIDLSSVSGVVLSYYYELGGSVDPPDAGDDLWVEYKNNVGVWVQVSQHLGADPAMTSFEQVIYSLPADAYHSGFQIRFHSAGTSGSDNWFIDNIRVDYSPDIDVTPASFSYTLLQGDSAVSELIISNTGLGGLNYNLVSIPVVNKNTRFNELLAAGEVEPARRKYADGFNDYEDVKGSVDPRTGSRVEKNAGGPDTHGYYWMDSDEIGGPVFDWVDVSTTGTDIVVDLNDDNYGGPYSIGFSFPYYDTVYTQIYIGSNGIIGFTSDSMFSRFKTNIPATSSPNNILAWLWDDLNPDDANNTNVHVYVDATAGRCVIQFVDYPEYGASAGDVVNAEIILEPDGTIKYQYLSIASGFDIANCTVGIENEDGTDGLEVAYLTSYLKDSLTIRFTPPYNWLELGQTAGNLAGGEADTIGLNITTVDLDTGLYEANLVVTSNDPDENPVTIPVSLTVTGEPQYICGDVNGNGQGPDVEDLSYLVAYLFQSGPPPPVMEAADMNGSGGAPLVDDLSYFVDYLFQSGPPPICGG